MAGLIRGFYADPPTFLEMLLECSRFLDKARHDPGCSKMDVLDSLENRLSLLVGKLVANPSSSTFMIYPSPAQAEDDDSPLVETE